MTAYRRAVIGLLVAIVALLAAVLVAVWSLQTPWGQRQLARVAEEQAERALDADISMDSIEGNLLRSPTIHGLSITREGNPLISAERVELRYDWRRLRRGTISLEAVTLVKPVIHLVRGPDGITLFDLFKPDEPGPREPRPFEIGDIRIVNGVVIIGPGVAPGDAVDLPNELRELNGRLAVDREPENTRIRVTQLSFAGVEPRFVLQRLSGTIRYANGDLIFDDLDVRTAASDFTIDGALENLGESPR